MPTELKDPVTRYKQLLARTYAMSNFDASCLLAYLMGYFSSNQKFLDEIEHWLDRKSQDEKPR